MERQMRGTSDYIIVLKSKRNWYCLYAQKQGYDTIRIRSSDKKASNCNSHSQQLWLDALHCLSVSSISSRIHAQGKLNH